MNQKEALIEAYQKGYRVVDGIAYKPNGQSLKGTPDRNGYMSIKPNKNTPVYIHRLLAYQKYGDIIFNPDIEVRHLDGIKDNNSDDNISLGDHSRNMMDKPKEQRRRDAGNQSRKHPHDEIIEYYNEVKSYKDTMRRFGLSSKGTLHFILNKSMATE